MKTQCISLYLREKKIIYKMYSIYRHVIYKTLMNFRFMDFSTNIHRTGIDSTMARKNELFHKTDF